MPEINGSRRRRAAANALLLAGVVLTAAGVVTWAGDEVVEPAALAAPTVSVPKDSARDSKPVPAGTTSGPLVSTSSPVPPAARPAGARVSGRPGAPLRLVVPARGIDAWVDAVQLQGDTLIPPSDPTRLGWWAAGSAAGSARGSTLIAGHTVRGGGGALDDLEEIALRDRVLVQTDNALMTYVVRKVRVLSKDELVEKAPRLFDQDAAVGRIVLLTCEDWNGSEYESNVVVTAVPRRR